MFKSTDGAPIYFVEKEIKRDIPEDLYQTVDNCGKIVSRSFPFKTKNLLDLSRKLMLINRMHQLAVRIKDKCATPDEHEDYQNLLYSPKNSSKPKDFQPTQQDRFERNQYKQNGTKENKKSVTTEYNGIKPRPPKANPKTIQ